MFKKYFKIYSVFFQNAVSFEAQYRKDTLVKLLMNFVWIGMTLLFIEVLFSHAQSIGGWGKEEVYLLTFFWMMVDEIDILFFQNIIRLPDIITDGELDVYLTKPVNKLFLVSTQYIYFKGVYKLLSEIAVFAIFICTFDLQFSISKILLACFLLVCGILVTYSIRLLINSLGFWHPRIGNINDLWFALYDLGKYPLSVLPKTLRILFLSVVPIAFSGYIPAAVLFGKQQVSFVVYAILFSFFLFLISIIFWNIAIKKYSSASS